MRKKGFQHFFRMFLWSEVFLSVGSLTDKTGPQPTNYRPNRHNSDRQPIFLLNDSRLGVPTTQLPTCLKIGETAQVRKLRNANTVPVSQNNSKTPRWRRVTAETALCGDGGGSTRASPAGQSLTDWDLMKTWYWDRAEGGEFWMPSACRTGKLCFSIFGPGHVNTLSAKGRPRPKWPKPPVFRDLPPVGVQSGKTYKRKTIADNDPG